MKLTAKQVEVLRKLDKFSACGTRKHTSTLDGAPIVSGTVASSLVRRGLAKRLPVLWGDSIVPGSHDIGITNEGRAALRSYDKENR